jgi:hypothetical protein
MELTDFNIYIYIAFLNELEREMPSLTPEEQQRIEAELERVKHEALEITTPPSPFRLDPISADVDSIGDGEESGASDDEGSLHSGYAGAYRGLRNRTQIRSARFVDTGFRRLSCATD